MTALAGESDPAVAARSERSTRKVAEAAERPTGPLLVLVSTRRQRLTVWGPDGKVTQSPVSTGRSGYETPHGVFSVLGKEPMHHSNLYDDAPMPFMQRLTWSGVALHAGNLPGYPASHGCIRLPYGFSKSLFGLTNVGTRVLVTHEETQPSPIEHPLLFKPLPADGSGPAVAEAVRPAHLAGLEPSRLGGPDRIAPNSLTGSGPHPSILPVTPADAAVRGQRTRAEIAAERTAAIATATSKVEAAAVRLGDVEAPAKSAALAATDALKALKAAQGQLVLAQRASRKIDVALQQQKAQLAVVARRKERTVNAAVFSDLMAREEAIEARIEALAGDEIKARAELALATAAVEEAEKRMRRADLDRAAQAGTMSGAAEALALSKQALERLKREQDNGARPITVLISRKTGKLHVRQGFDELFEAPVTLASPGDAIGTHVFTAVGTEAGGALRWTVVTLQGDTSPDERPRKSRRAREAPDDVPDNQSGATAARVLDRIAIAPDVVERIAEFIKPGSSLIVSDLGPSRETGKGTDYVLLTR